MISTNSYSKISRGTLKNLNNINASIKEGKYYEAHQMLHSVSQRFNIIYFYLKILNY